MALAVSDQPLRARVRVVQHGRSVNLTLCSRVSITVTNTDHDHTAAITATAIATAIQHSSPPTHISTAYAPSSYATLGSAIHCYLNPSTHSSPHTASSASNSMSSSTATAPGTLVKDHATAQQIIEREGVIGKWTDKVIFITGASSGIGTETARALYHTGAHLFLPVRDQAKGEKVRQVIESNAGGHTGKITMLTVDLESQASVKECVAEFLTHSKKLNVLICNAGVMATPQGRTKDGLETQFGVNHIAHFLLFQLLKPALLASSTADFNSRVVMLSSSAHKRSPVLWDDFNQEKREYNPWTAYGQAKTANAYCALEIDRRYGSRGLHANAVHPGVILTGLQQHMGEAGVAGLVAMEGVKKVLKTQEQGAATTVWAAVAKEWEGRGGQYLEDVSVSVPETEDMAATFRGYKPYLVDSEQSQRLWVESLKIVGLDDDEHLNR